MPKLFQNSVNYIAVFMLSESKVQLKKDRDIYVYIIPFVKTVRLQ